MRCIECNLAGPDAGEAIEQRGCGCVLCESCSLTHVHDGSMSVRRVGRLGGRATSEAKAAAARLNGRKGGRPKKP